jgi:rare lipoprotein A (RlpA)-like double-psi beta-barrel protein
VVGGSLARAGVVAFGLALSVPFASASNPVGWRAVSVATFEGAAVQGIARAPQHAREPAQPTVAAAAEATPDPTPEPTPEPTPQPVVVAVAPPQPATGGLVLASWYGPGFYGNRTACGHTYTPQIVGVAHKTLPCGTVLTLSYRERTVTVPVIDRGPYIAGRTLDLSNATRLALGCPDLCTLSMRVGP